MALVSNLATLDVITETWVDSVTTGLNTGTFSGTYTPTLSSIAVGTGGSATNTANYAFVGGVLVVSGIIQFGTAGATYPGASNLISLPSGFVPAPAVSPNYLNVGNVHMLAGGVTAVGGVLLVSTTQVRVYVYGAGSTYLTTATLSTTIPGGWVAADFIRWNAVIPGTMS